MNQTWAWASALMALAACTQDDAKPRYVDRKVVDSPPVATDDTGVGGDSGGLGDPPPAVDEACEGLDPAPGFPQGTINCSAGTCRVPEGQFYMGSLDGHPDECPTRRLSLPEFRIDRTEVTWAAYDSCVNDGTCEALPDHCLARASELSGGDPDDFPVTCVNWAQAKAYCEYAGGRLPSEAEWEKAARGEEGAWWPWGGAIPTCDFTNFRFVSWYCEPGVVEVGSYYPSTSPYGAVDMTGNAWEWVADYYDAEWYRVAPGVDGPTDNCHDIVGGDAGPCVERVMRGGAYNVTEFNTRNAARTSASPELADDNIGFRCVYSE